MIVIISLKDHRVVLFRFLTLLPSHSMIEYSGEVINGAFQ